MLILILVLAFDWTASVDKGELVIKGPAELKRAVPQGINPEVLMMDATPGAVKTYREKYEGHKRVDIHFPDGTTKTIQIEKEK